MRRRDLNWSSVSRWWDRLRGTYRVDAPPGDVRTGLPAYAEPSDRKEPLRFPFKPQPDVWQSPVSS